MVSFLCVRELAGRVRSRQVRDGLYGYFFVEDRGGSSDLALVATPPAVPSGVHLSTAGEDLCFLDVCLDPFFGVVGWLVWEPFYKKNQV